MIAEFVVVIGENRLYGLQVPSVDSVGPISKAYVLEPQQQAILVWVTHLELQVEQPSP